MAKSSLKMHEAHLNSAVKLHEERGRALRSQLKPAPAVYGNPSGIHPTEFKVLVRPMEVENKIGSIILPDEAKEKQEFVQQEGILVAISPAAFSFFEDDARQKAPKPGDRVLYAKYAGFTRKGRDGVEYRIINDKDVCAVLD